jgi:hypothetical protein
MGSKNKAHIHGVENNVACMECHTYCTFVKFGKFAIKKKKEYRWEGINEVENK